MREAVLLNHLTIKPTVWTFTPLLGHPLTWALAVLGSVALGLALRAELRGE